MVPTWYRVIRLCFNGLMNPILINSPSDSHYCEGRVSVRLQINTKESEHAVVRVPHSPGIKMHLHAGCECYRSWTLLLWSDIFYLDSATPQGFKLWNAESSRDFTTQLSTWSTLKYNITMTSQHSLRLYSN